MNQKLDKSLSDMSEEEQILYMEDWFRDHYEDPAQECPYSEGEYTYIYGGPYDAYEELEQQFSDEVPEELISQLAAKLSLECYYWSGKEFHHQRIFDYVEPNPEYYKDFQISLTTIEKIAELQLDKDVQLHILKLLYINVVTTLETYLSEAFTTLINCNPIYKRQFLENNLDFNKEKFPISDLFKVHEKIDQYINKYLSELSWHRLDKIEGLYLAAFNLKFMENKQHLFSAINNRHHLVHRGGKDKDGNTLVITKNDVIDLIKDVRLFGIYLYSQLSELNATN
ncbi:hypothetical protein [Legionella pneumophila]